jgi:hypothetical protein
VRTVVNVARLLRETVAFTAATRRMSMLVAIVLGLIVIAAAVATTVFAPYAVYPFL